MQIVYFSIPWANPTTVSYNASAVKKLKRLVRFENIFFSFTMINTLTYYNAGVEVVNSKIVVLGPDFRRYILAVTVHLKLQTALQCLSKDPRRDSNPRFSVQAASSHAT
jgi:hypothetical protein